MYVKIFQTVNEKTIFLINFSDLIKRVFLDGFIQIGNLQYYILKYVRNLKKSCFGKKLRT